ncbi:peroxide stress protein YaaA [Psittacicella hinzii]|uniref:UPF0246 protein CKF58_03585 n=1 Tax=Psittacicella hinzii TaxID=2028575 RepID=A0A3A1YNB3_9GAMM|nr:peroxide stress protein YaaA [Psittacicella hinzii]RIY38728.1 hypothetical protein CKF58_03585 [Psittacicella hinzii]
MLVLLSPAKTFNEKLAVPPGKFTIRTPYFYDQAQVLVEQLKTFTPTELAKLLDVSEKIADTNYARYHSWQAELTTQNSKPAAFSFWGDVNKHFDAFTLSRDDLNYADNHVLYLSGLYGVLRPLDFMQEYRLEMGKSLATSPSCRNLYQFWQERLVSYLNQRIKDEKIPVIVNLASKEYFGAVDAAKLKVPVIEIQFKDQKNGVHKVISVIAKRSRGTFARWIVQNRVTTVADLQKFDVDGYYFKPEESTETLYTFYRDEKK